MSKESRFRGLFNEEHGKRAEPLLKYERQHFTIFIDPFEGNSGWKGLSEGYEKS